MPIRNWSLEEIRILKREYPNLGSSIPQLKKKGRTRYAIQNKAREQGILTPTRGCNNWSNEEIKILRDNFSWTPKQELMSLLLDRSLKAIVSKASKLGIYNQVPAEMTKLITGGANDLEIGFVVGMIEGEGSIVLYRKGGRISPRVGIANSDKGLLEKCKRIMGGKIYAFKRRIPNRKVAYSLVIASLNGVYETLVALRPFLMSERKTRICDLVLAFCESKRQRSKKVAGTLEEETIYEKVRQLNK